MKERWNGRKGDYAEALYVCDYFKLRGSPRQNLGVCVLPSHEVCRLRGQSHPQLGVCTSTSYSIQKC